MIMNRLFKWCAVIFIMLAFMLPMGCQNMQVKFPDTPKGRSLYLMNVYDSSKMTYMARFPLPQPPPEPLVDNLASQRTIMIEGYHGIKCFGEHAATGVQVPQACLDRVNWWLAKLQNDMLYSSEAFAAKSAHKELTDEQIKTLMVKAGIIEPSSMFKSKAIDPVIAGALIELIRMSITAYTELIKQAEMTPEEVDAAFAAKWPVFSAYDPEVLPNPRE
jgi:hypothetical protein